MQDFKLPLSGNVSQAFWGAFASPFNNQFGLINISLGQSNAPAVERQVLDQVGSYGRQLGRIGDALGVLLKHFRPCEPLSKKEAEALIALKLMLNDIADIKTENNREALKL